MEKDLEIGRCLSDDKRYADLINGLLFSGEQRIQESDLQEVDSRSFLKRWSRKKSERYRPLRRDLIKKSAFGVNFALIGVENQELDEEAYDMIAACTHAVRLIPIKKTYRKDGKVDMCQALEEMLADDLEEDIEVLRPFYEKVKAQKD